jgi:hypothetical protein
MGDRKMRLGKSAQLFGHLSRLVFLLMGIPYFCFAQMAVLV